MNRSQALQYIEQLWGKGELEESTHRYALIVVDLISDAGNEELLCCQKPEELSAWIRRDALAWQAKLSEEAFAEQFEVGHGAWEFPSPDMKRPSPGEPCCAFHRL